MDVPNWAAPSEEERRRLKKKLVQKQLAMLLHAERCKRREANPNNLARLCDLPHCRAFRDVHSHMETCQAGSNCTVPYCASLRIISLHRNRCFNDHCVTCSLLKRAGAPTPKEWQQSITDNQRGHLIGLLVDTISSSFDGVVLGRTIQDKTECGQILEQSMYKSAYTLSEYYLMLADKKWEIEMDIEERRRKQQRDDFYRRRRETQVYIAARRRSNQKMTARLQRAFGLRREQPDRL